MPDARFVHNMGVASVIAGVVLMALSQVLKWA